MNRRRRLVLDLSVLSGLPSLVLIATDYGLWVKLHSIAVLADLDVGVDDRVWLVTDAGAPLLGRAELARAAGLDIAELEASLARLARVDLVVEADGAFGVRTQNARARGRHLSQTPDAVRARARRAARRPSYVERTDAPTSSVATPVVRSVDRPTTVDRPPDDRTACAGRPAGVQPTTAVDPTVDRPATARAPSAPVDDREAACAVTPSAPEMLRAGARSSSSSSSSDHQKEEENEGVLRLGSARAARTATAPRPAKAELERLARHLRSTPAPSDADLELLDGVLLDGLCDLYSERCASRLREVGQEPPRPSMALRRALVERFREDASWVQLERWSGPVAALAANPWYWTEKRSYPGGPVVPATLEWLVLNVTKVRGVRAESPRARPLPGPGHHSTCACATCSRAREVA
jgi:hypothetical protein